MSEYSLIIVVRSLHVVNLYLQYLKSAVSLFPLLFCKKKNVTAAPLV